MPTAAKQVRKNGANKLLSHSPCQKLISLITYFPITETGEHCHSLSLGFKSHVMRVKYFLKLEFKNINKSNKLNFLQIIKITYILIILPEC